MVTRNRILITVSIVVIYFLNPLYIRSSATGLVGSLFSLASLAPVLDPGSLKAAVNNVTTDYDQLTTLLEDFFERLPNNSTEILFRDYLTTKASRRHKELERMLDWVLGFYRFAWPFLIVYIVLRMTSGSTKAELDREFAAADPTRSSKKKVEDFPAARSSAPTTARKPSWRSRATSSNAFG